MKINLKLIEKMVEAGATGGVVLAYLLEQNAIWSARKAADRTRKSKEPKRKRAELSGTVRNGAENVSREANLTDTPRARLFRVAKPALLTLGISNTRAGALITEWLKFTNDDDQLVVATILKAQELAVADAPGWILATLKGKTNGKRTSGSRSQSSGADFFAGLAEVAKDISRDGGMAGNADAEIPVGRVNIDG